MNTGNLGLDVSLYFSGKEKFGEAEDIKINQYLGRFIGESFKDFRRYIGKLEMNLSIAQWMQAVKNFPRHSNAHEVALRKIEVEIYHKIRPNDNVKYSLDPDSARFREIDQSTFVLTESDLECLYAELKLPKRVLDYKEDDLRQWRRPVEPPISWGMSHTEYWRAFPTAVTLYAVACALYRINEVKYGKLLDDAEKFCHEKYDRYYYQMIPETCP